MWGTSPRNLHLLFGAPRRTGRCSWLRCGRSSRTQYLRCAICRRRLGKAPPHSRRKDVTCAPYSAQEGPNRDSPSHLPHHSDSSRQAGWRPRTPATLAATRSPSRSLAAAATVPREGWSRTDFEQSSPSLTAAFSFSSRVRPSRSPPERVSLRCIPIEPGRYLVPRRRSSRTLS